MLSYYLKLGLKPPPFLMTFCLITMLCTMRPVVVGLVLGYSSLSAAIPLCIFTSYHLMKPRHGSNLSSLTLQLRHCLLPHAMYRRQDHPSCAVIH